MAQQSSASERFRCTHKRLGEVAYSYGEGTLGGRPALLVVSEDHGGAKASIRLRPAVATTDGKAD